MQLTFWINAFIPRTVAGYTQRIARGRHGGKTAIPLPGAARINPFNTFKDWHAGYLTDQRGFSDLPGASVRMRSIAEIDLSGGRARLICARHASSGTTEVDMDTGDQLGYAVADMTRCRWSALEPAVQPVGSHGLRVPLGGTAVVHAGVSATRVPVWEMTVLGQAGDPLVSAAADIDYEGTFSITLPGPGRVRVAFEGKLDRFPAFEAYARLASGSGTLTKTLFRSSPPAGNTVMNLLGRASRPVSGHVDFP